MNQRPIRALALAGLMALAACSQPAQPPAQAAAAAATAAPAQAVAAPAPAVQPAPSAPQPAAAPEAATPRPAPTAPVGPAPVAGTDYVEIPGGQPYAPADGRIEVVEVFGYVCPACAQFQPLVNAWENKLPADVRFTYVPAPFGPDWMPYAKGFYVAQSMGLVGRSHDALVEAIHVRNAMPGEGDKPTDEAVAKFYAGYGADEQQFLSQMRSFATNAKVNRGKQFMMRSGVDSTPSIVVNGKYKVKGRSFEDMLRITDHLVAAERARAGAAAPSRG